MIKSVTYLAKSLELLLLGTLAPHGLRDLHSENQITQIGLQQDPKKLQIKLKT